MKLRVRNLTKKSMLGDAVDIADSSRKRRTGLLKHTALPRGEGLYITPCEGVHTFGMKFPIDVLFVSRDKRVLKVRPAIPPARISLCLRAHSVIELPAGTAEETGTGVGDQLEFERYE
jgi:uncharacterized membrane protein (UPF0127 family)